MRRCQMRRNSIIRVWRAMQRWSSWTVCRCPLHTNLMPCGTTWLVHTWYVSFICHMTRLHVTWLIYMWHDLCSSCTACMWLLHINLMPCGTTWLMHMWHDSFISDMTLLCVSCVCHVCVMCVSCVCQVCVMCVSCATWLIHVSYTRNMTYSPVSHVRQEAFMRVYCVSWLIHVSARCKYTSAANCCGSVCDICGVRDCSGVDLCLYTMTWLIHGSVTMRIDISSNFL